jgi:malonyl CoA-acyl carrier protein transacylase
MSPTWTAAEWEAEQAVMGPTECRAAELAAELASRADPRTPQERLRQGVKLVSDVPGDEASDFERQQWALQEAVARGAGNFGPGDSERSPELVRTTQELARAAAGQPGIGALSAALFATAAQNVMVFGPGQEAECDRIWGERSNLAILRKLWTDEQLRQIGISF